MQMRFYTPAYGVAEEFGAASFGFAGAEDETLSNSVLFPYDIKGSIFCGSYEECLNQIPEQKWQVGIVLLGNAGDENDFVHKLAKKVNVPLVGGGAAINPVNGESGLITGRGQAAVFMINDERYSFEVMCENIHSDILGEHVISFSKPRIIEKIDGEEPRQWLCKKKEKLGLAPDDFEHLTLSDLNGINAHLSEKKGKIFSGRDLNERMYLRYVPERLVNSKMQKFYDDKNAIVFGCAGLKGILTDRLQTKGLGLFMFGEVCTKDGSSEFGNLMLSKLRVLKK